MAQRASPHRNIRRGPGLFGRISLLATFIALICVAGFGSLTYLYTRNVLLDRQTESIVAQTSNHARQIMTFAENETAALSDSDEGIPTFLYYQLLDSLTDETGPRLAIRISPETPDSPAVWVTDNPLRFGSEMIPKAMISEAESGMATQMRTPIASEQFLIVGVPLEAGGNQLLFFEAGSLRNTVEILDVLRNVVYIGGGITLLASVAIGLLMVRRSLSSIRVFRRAAEKIRQGSFTPVSEPVHKDFGALQESFNEMQTSIARRIEREKRFALEVSHELRSPLTTVVTSADIIKRHKGDLSPDAQTALDLLLGDVDRFSNLVLDLLEISRPPESIEMEFKTLKTREFLDSLSQHTGEVVVATDAEQFEGDPKLLSQIFNNLIENAIRYAEGITKIEVTADGSDLRFAVEDSGPGVPEEEREMIFERFTRGSVGADRSKSGGTGLGLALARERTTLHGGSIWVENSETGGARFIVSLPRQPASQYAISQGSNRSRGQNRG